MQSPQTNNEEKKPKKNRRTRRFEKALARRSKTPKPYYGVSYWVQRLVKEMKDNADVQEKVASGALDKYLG